MKKVLSEIKKPIIFVLIFYCFPALAQVPTISSFTPTSGTIGTTVTIAGTNFNPTPANNRIYFGAVKAIPSAGTTTSLTVTVPVGATSVTPLVVQDVTTGRQGSSITSITPQFTITISPPGLPAYSSSTTGSLGVGPISVATGDFNGDGKVDMAVVNNTSNNVGIRLGNGLGGFSGSTTVAVGTDPRLVATGDFNGDGQTDLAVANYSGNSVSIRLGNGSGGFTGSITIPIATNTRAVTIGDFNEDGIADLAGMSSFGTSIKLGDGLGGFSGSTTIAGAFPYSASVGDFNEDSKADLAIANNGSSSVSIRLGDGLGGFSGTTDVGAGTNPRSMVIGDFNKDGKMDFANANQTSNDVSVRFGDGLGGFSGSTTIPVGSNPLTIAIGDLNGDGNADLITANQASNNVSILLGDGLGGFSPTTISIGSSPFSVATGDFNGDGTADLAIANNGSNNVSILMVVPAVPTITSFTPTSASTGATVTITGTNFTGATAVSFGGTAATSFTVVSATSITAVVAGGTSGNVSVTTPGGTANFAGFTLVPGPPTITSFTPTFGPIGTTVTVTGTNFHATPANNIVYFGATKANVTAATTTQLTVTVPVGATFQPISVLVNGLTVYSSSPFVVTFSGGGTIDACSFAPKVDFPITAGSGSHFVAMSDVDGDGKSDLIVTDGVTGSISILRNTSSTGAITAGSFAAKVDFPLGVNPRDMVVSDLDGDGKPDIAAPSLNGNFISVFRNTSTPGSITTGSFAPKVDFATGANPFGLALGDIDSDGKPDLVAANNGSGTISVFRNTSIPGSISAGSFDAKVDFATGSFPNHVAIRDMDVDNKPDVVVANYASGTVSVFKNTSTSGPITAGSFAARVDLAGGTNPYSIAIGDLDVDGKPDIVSGDQTGNRISVFRNIGTAGTITSGSFAPTVHFATGLWVEVVSMGDLDGDGKLDLVASNNNSNSVSVFKNGSSPGSIVAGSFSRIDFGAGTNPYGSTIGDLDGDGRPELAVMHSGSNTVSVYWNSIGSVSLPSITSFTPSSGPIGTSVTITGTNFSTPFSNSVTFNGTPATIIGSTATSITAIVPATASNGLISVTIGCNTINSATNFTVIPLQCFTDDFNGSILDPRWITVNPNPASAVSLTGSGQLQMFASALNGGSDYFGSSNFNMPRLVTPISGDWTIETQFDFSPTNDMQGAGIILLSQLNPNSTTGFAATGRDFALGFGGQAMEIFGVPSVYALTTSYMKVRKVGNTLSAWFGPNASTLTGPLTITDATNYVYAGIYSKRQPWDGNTAVHSTANYEYFKLALGAPPSISSFSPASGGTGTAVTITGTTFDPVPANNLVKFNGVVAPVTASTATSLTVTVPAGATTGLIEVTIGCNTIFSATSFVLQLPPTITSFTPASGPVGTTVTITGTNFSATPSNNIVYFGATKANVTAATTTQLTVTVPVGATYQPISVLVNGLTAYSSSPFVVTFSGGGTIDACSFAPKVDFPISAGSGSHFVAISDLDGDGKSDLIVTDAVAGSISVLRNTSSTGAITAGSFAAKVDFPLGANPRDIVVRDLDGDGKPDIAAPSFNGNYISVFRNTSTPGSITTGSFAPKVDFATGANPFGLTVDDVDGDGKPDLIAANNGSSTISVFRNTSIPGAISASSFDTKVDFATGSFPNHVAIRDMDADGKPDVVVANYGSSTVSVFKNTSTSGSITAGSFAARVDLAAGPSPYSIAIGDLDGDGKPDIASGNQTGNTISVFRNIGTAGTITAGSFAPIVQFTTGSWVEVVSMGDLDGDGKLDLVASNNVSNSVSVFKNASSPGPITAGSFSRIDFGAGTNPYGSAIGDLDGDGRPDLAVMHSGSNMVSVYWNAIASVALPSITSFVPSSGPIGASVTITGTNFSTPFSNSVSFNGIPATITGSTASSLTVTVPAGATTGLIEVTIGCNTINSATNFTVTPHTQLGNVIEMNGSTDYVRVADNPSLRPTSLTIETWFNFNTLSGGIAIVGKPVGSATQNSFQIWYEAGRINAGVNPFSIATGIGNNFVPSLGQWYHVAFTYNDVTKVQKLYVDGSLIASGIGTTPIYDAKDFLIGADIDFSILGGFLNGKIDEVRLWSTDRSQSELQSTMNTTLAGNEPGLVAYYKMDEIGQGAGISVQNSATATGAVLNGVTVGTGCTPIFTILPPPTISSFSPGSGTVGTTVTITGTNFNPSAANNIIKFNGTLATTITSTGTSLTVNIPPGATTGPIEVTVGCNTVTSSSNFTITVPNNSIKFNGTDQEAQLGTWFNYQNFTISLWVKPGATQVEFADIIDNNHNATRSWVFQKKFGTPNTYTFSAAPYTPAEVTLTANTWQHITLKIDNSSSYIYLNGCLVSSASGGPVTYDGTQTLKLADWSIGQVDPYPNRSWNGEIEEVKIYDRALSDAEVQAGVYNEELPSAINLQAYYKMNEAGGSIIADASPNTRHGTLVNSPVFQLANTPLAPPPHTIVSFTPGAGIIGTVVTIIGTNFELIPANNIVRFNGVPATVTASTATSITTVVPAGATTGPIQVTVGCSTVNSTNFIVNQVPTSANASVTTNEDVNFTFGAVDFPFTDDGAFAGVEITSLETAGDLEYNGIDVTLNQICPNITLLVFKPATDANGSSYAVFGFKVIDNLGASSAAAYTMSVNVTPVNDVPVITAQVPLSTPEETALAILVGNVTVIDPDGAAPTLTVQNGTNYTRIGNTITPDLNFNGTLTVPVTVSDGIATSPVFNVSVTVTPVNDPPLITAQIPLSTPEETSLTILVGNLTVVDPDGAAPTLTVQTGTNYTLVGNTITPDLDFNGTLTVPVTVNDGIVSSPVFNLSVTVSAVNDAPVITAQVPLTTPEETSLTILVANLTITDVDNSVFTLSVQNGANYTRVGNVITPNLDFNGTLTVPVTVSDGTTSSAVFNVSVTVTPVNDAPVITAQVALSTPEETSLAILIGNVTVVDPDNAAFTLSVQNGTNYTRVGNTITPDLDFNGILTVPVTVSDGTVSGPVFNLSVTVTPINDTPVITAQVPLTTPEKTALTILVANLTISDPDNTVFTLSVQNGTSYSRAGNTITPDVGFIGILTVPVTVNDGTISSAVFNLSVSVTPCVPPGTPTITSSITPSAGVVLLCSGNSVTLSAPAGFASYLWSNTATTQVISVSSSGSHSVVVTNASGCASSSSNALTVTVLPGPCNNRPPVISATQLIIPIGGKVSLALAPLISDPDGNLDLASLKIKVQATGTAASIGANSTLIADYTGRSFAGIDRLTLEVCDLLGACTQKELTIDVIGDIVIYGGISPNNDGKNDAWIIQYIESIDQTKDNKVSLFNRWGDVVFEVENYDNSNKVFKGINKNGEDLPTGTYFYKIEFLSGRTTQTGYISLKR